MQPFIKHTGLVAPHATLAAAIVLGFVCFLTKPSTSATQSKVFKQQSEEEEKHHKWLRERMEEAHSIKVGMSRAELLKVFDPDGGRDLIPPIRYVLDSCSLIKVDVQFEIPKGTPIAHLPPDNELKITSISKPYLEPMFMD
jgi:hypothetical protein